MASLRYIELTKQIAALEAQAAKLKSEETAGVIAKIKEAIDIYGLTTSDIFGSPKGPVKHKSGAAASATATAKYADGKGGIWGGRGKRPQWLRDALAAGRSMHEFLTGSAPASAAAPKAAAKKAGKAKPGKKGSGAKYSDGAGNSWSGMGPKPKWFKDALAAGKTVEELHS